MLTCRNGRDLCFLSWQTPYSLSIRSSSQRFAMDRQLLFSYSAITYRRDKVTSLRKNTFVTLLRNSRFRRMQFSRFLRTTTCRTVWSHPCRDDSVSYATHRFIIAVDNKNKRPQNYTFLCMFVALIGVMLVISKGNIHLLFGAASHLSTNILMLCGVTCWVIYTNGGASFQSWSPLRYTTLTCLFGSISLITIVTF